MYSCALPQCACWVYSLGSCVVIYIYYVHTLTHSRGSTRKKQSAKQMVSFRSSASKNVQARVFSRSEKETHIEREKYTAFLKGLLACVCIFIIRAIDSAITIISHRPGQCKWVRRQLFSQCPFLFAPTPLSCNIYVRPAFLFIHLDAKSSFIRAKLFWCGASGSGNGRRSFSLILCARFRPPSAFFTCAPAGSDDVMILSLCAVFMRNIDGLTALSDCAPPPWPRAASAFPNN
jgi:hypothetical protein